MDKFEFIEHIAEILFKRDMRMSISDLADLLNQEGYKTDYDTEYEGTRGTFRFVSAAYARMKAEHGEYFANELAKCFVNDKGEYAYET